MRLNPSLWSLGPILVELAKITQRMQHSVIKIIKRETNKIADKLTEKATQAECNTVIKIKREANKNADKVTKEARQAKRTLGPLLYSALWNFQWKMSLFQPISKLCL